MPVASCGLARRARPLTRMSSSPDAPTPRSSYQAQSNADAPASVSSEGPARLTLWTGWAAAACFALSTAYFGANYFTTRSQLSLASNDAELASADAQSLSQRLEAERILSSSYIASLQKSADVANLAIARLTAPSGDTSPAAAIAVWNPLSQQGILIVEKLPALAADQDYQLWISDPAHPDSVSAGVFTVTPDGAARVAFRPEKPAAAATAFTVRRERKGGSPKPEGPVVAIGTL
jgi:hypothetical protein